MRLTSGKHVAKDPEALRWWDSLVNDPEATKRVIDWCRDNPPPAEWTSKGFSRIDWAYTEMPFAPDRR